MIAEVTGHITDIFPEEHCIIMRTSSGLSYEIMIPAYYITTLVRDPECSGNPVSMVVLEFLEGAAAGNILTPRLIGFPTRQHRDFFEKFTSVKGLGNKKAVRALARPIHAIARAIEDENEKDLVKLPEIGPKAAKQIIATLKGSLTRFLLLREEEVTVEKTKEDLRSEILDVLVQLGYKGYEAEQMVDLAMDQHKHISEAEDLIQIIYKMQAEQ